MTVKTLIDAVADRTGETKARTAVTVETAFAEIAAQLAAGNDVTLPGFGKFVVAQRAARDGRNPATGEAIKIAAKQVPAFRPAAALREAVNPKPRVGGRRTQQRRQA
jgi:DNA-binding protein HU-beta